MRRAALVFGTSALLGMMAVFVELQYFPLVLLIWIAIPAPIVLSFRRSRDWSGWMLTLYFASFALMLLGGALWPNKSLDEELPLTTGSWMLGDLARVEPWHLAEGVDPGIVLKLHSPRPSRATLAAMLREQARLRVRMSHSLCASPKTVFTGLGPSALPVRVSPASVPEQEPGLHYVFDQVRDAVGRLRASASLELETGRLRLLLRDRQGGTRVMECAADSLAPGFRATALAGSLVGPARLLLFGEDLESEDLRVLALDLETELEGSLPPRVLEDRHHPGFRAPRDALLHPAAPTVTWLLDSDSGDILGMPWPAETPRMAIEAEFYPELVDATGLACHRALPDRWLIVYAGHGSLEPDPHRWHSLAFFDEDGDGWIDP